MIQILWRILLVVIFVVIVLALLPPFFHIVGFSPSADVWQVIRICIGGLAVLYVLAGPPVRIGGAP